MQHTRIVCIGSSDYGNVWLKRVGERIVMKRYAAVDYADMEEYIRHNADTLREWQEAVYNGNTEDSYDDRMNDYSYDYDSYYDYDSDTDEYYDGYVDDTLCDSWGTDGNSREDMIEMVMEDFNDNFSQGDFEFNNNLDNRGLEQLIGEFYNECIEYLKELEEQKKPHWKAFTYYK